MLKKPPSAKSPSAGAVLRERGGAGAVRDRAVESEVGVFRADPIRDGAPAGRATFQKGSGDAGERADVDGLAAARRRAVVVGVNLIAEIERGVGVACGVGDAKVAAVAVGDGVDRAGESGPASHEIGADVADVEREIAAARERPLQAASAIRSEPPALPGGDDEIPVWRVVVLHVGHFQNAAAGERDAAGAERGFVRGRAGEVKRAGIDGGAAGVGVRAGEQQRAEAGLRERAAAADRAADLQRAACGRAIINSTIANNTSTVKGGGISIDQNEIFIENTIVVNNTTSTAAINGPDRPDQRSAVECRPSIVRNFFQG